MTSRLLRLGVFVSLVLSFDGAAAASDRLTQPVRTEPVAARPITRVVSTYGVLAPRIEDLSFRINGRIEAFHVNEGDRVVAGQLLAELERRDTLDQLEKARVARDQAARQVERLEALASERMVQASQLEDARDALETTRIAFEQAELQLTRCELRAPAAGVILKEFVDSRTTVSAGVPIYSFRDASGSWITEVELTDRNAFVFGIGTTARARFAPYPGEVFTGELTRQAGVADENDGLYTVEVTIATRGRELRPGMVVEIDLIHESDTPYTTVPLDALVDLRGNRGMIYLLDDTGAAVMEKVVHVVAITGGNAALAEPIEPGRQVVTRGQQSLRDQTAVRVL